MEIFFNVLLVTVPALIVAFTAYYLLRQLITGQLAQGQFQVQQSRQQTVLPLRLQAYERLSLFCERIAIPSMLLRTRQPEQTAGGLRLALLFSIQQEYEHNITQQVYVSEQLWQIIKAARDDSSQLVDLVSEKVDMKADAQVYVQALLAILERREADPIAMAQAAIRREAAGLF